MSGLTHQQSACLRFIERYIEENGGASPSYSEIEAALELSSKSRVFALMQGLEERGHIRRLKGQARSIEIVSSPLAGFPARLAALSDASFAQALDIVAAEVARRAEAAA
ncbi:LexA family protein [Brevundimonas viscosa]|uniref:LexA family protein n=1 Tax=Brevundimonas viscosa TaxID=871741 RepID=UPI0015A60E72|nr:hypothetical protein [Brevundimonas viscosa]